MAAGLACSACDLTHHLPPGSPCLQKKKVESFTLPLQAVGCELAAAQNDPGLIYMGDMAHRAIINALNASECA